MTTLKGVTWKHDRGLAPMLATAREFEIQNPGVHIDWEVRSLHEFGDGSTRSFAESYDLIVIDHPFIGEIARDRSLLSLDELLSRTELDTLRTESVGLSHQSYNYEGRQWALAIDAVSQVAGYRPDLLEAAGVPVPETWDDVFELTRIRPGFVSLALFPLDSLMCFFTLCANAGHPPFSQDSNCVADRDAAESALLQLKRLAKSSSKDAMTLNPIALWERMSTTDDIAYCPLAFGYSNYSRTGYRRSLLAFTNIPSSGAAGCSGSTLGGAGLAISKRCPDIAAAARYAAWVAGADCQRTLYVDSGGQPGNKRAWTDPEVNALTHNFFFQILPTVEHAFLRPRFVGFTQFQNRAFGVISKFLESNEPPAATLDTVDELYRKYVPERS